MSKLIRAIARREPRILGAEGIAGTVAEMRYTWKRRIKKPLRKNHPTAPGESASGDAAAGLHSPTSALPEP